MKIKKLPAEAISKLQSGLIITDAVQCVLELVHNSLDAEATGVAVRIDLKTYQIRVIDNGKGIGREDLEFVGEKFMTSKYHSFHSLNSTFPTYGFKGQALSSLLDLCKSLTIETKSENDGPTFLKVFQNNQDPAISEIQGERNGTGTTVTVEDFMCTMPVRRKRISEVFDIEEIKTQLQYLAIMHYNVCFTLRNENKALILLQTSQASSKLEAISNIFGKTVAKSLTALYYKEKKFEVTGFITLKPQFQSNVQLLYVNKRIITKGVTHKFMNNVMKEYVGKYSLCIDSPSAQIMKGLKNYCYNIFILEIQCPHSQYELFTNMRKTTVEFKNWKDVLRCLHKAVKRAYKEVLNLDSSSINQENVGSSKKDLIKYKKVFGTSVLINAVKGVPVKRGLNNEKKEKRKKQKKSNEIQDKSHVHRTEDAIPMGEMLNDSGQKENSYDSLESPIPKKHPKENAGVRGALTLNQSFFEFYEWVKGKLETDENAFNLYSDFLQFKNRGNPHLGKVTEVAQFKSPVLGGKLKRKKMEKEVRSKKLKRKQERERSTLEFESALDEEMAIVTRQQLKLFPNTCLRMRKTVQFTAEGENYFRRHLNFNPVGPESTLMNTEHYNFPHLSVVSRQAEPKRTLPSLPSSEIQLTNTIQFRNWSEDILQQPSDIYKDRSLESTAFPASATWASHYQESPTQTAHHHVCKPVRGIAAIQGDENTEDFSFPNVEASGGLEGYSRKKRSNTFRDVEIQVDTSKTSSEKVNAVVQTSLTDSLIPESPYFKKSDLINKKLWKAGAKDAQVERTKQLERRSFSQEVPNPDFWNLSSHIDNIVEQPYEPDESVETPTSALVNKRNSSSSELVCGQKSNSLTKPQNDGNLSKETQTLVAIWADSLTEILNKQTDSNPKSESTLPKTIPIEDIECNILQPTESRFCLTGRHDFIPKGLSPPVFSTETNRTFTLSPGEKSRLKLTVESAQSDLLAVVKWQDESTGDYMKPFIPSEILYEMQQNAGKNATTSENPVLSASLSCCAVKVHNLLHSFTFTKELLSDVEILGQLDRKFIVTKMKLFTPKKMELISLFDQHAVDERIKLEELIRDYSLPNGKFIASRLNPPVECALNETDVRVLLNSNEKLLNIGLRVEMVNECTVSVKEIPTFLLDKHEKDVKNRRNVPLSDVLQALIVSVVEEMKETRGVLSKIPKVIHNALCLEACHRAIKFNRALSPENITQMMNKLKDCKLPFQCAHGRPSVIPIIDLEDFHSMMKGNESVELRKLRKFRNADKPTAVIESSISV